MQTSNPALNFGEEVGIYLPADQRMTVSGTAVKTFLLLILAVSAAAFSWGSPMAPILMTAGGLGGFVVAIVASFKKSWSPVLAPMYALLKGLLLGGLSAFFEQQYPGIAFQAMGLTFGTLGCMLLVYQSGLITVNQQFVMGVAAATGGIFIFYLISFGLSFFGFDNPAFGNGLIGIGFSFLVVGIAALNLILDFSFINDAAAEGAPKYMEWYGAFALMVTLVWLYIEILRLLAKLNSRE